MYIEAEKSQSALRQKTMRTATLALATTACSLILLLPAIINQAPFIYYDSAAYLKNAVKTFTLLKGSFGSASGATVGTDPSLLTPRASIDDNIISGRSVYYSAFTEVASLLGGIVGIVFVQAFILSVLIVVSVQTVLPKMPTVSRYGVAIVIAGTLSLLTSAGFFVSFVTPDIWAGMMTLAFALMLTTDRDQNKGAHFFFAVILMLAALFHTSHLLLLAGLIALSTIAFLLPVWREAVKVTSLVLPIVALMGGVAGSFAYSQVIKVATGKPPVTMPFVTAHLIDMGPGMRLVENTCPDSGLEICSYVDRLPTDWTTFLFSEEPDTAIFWTADPQSQRGLSDEQARFAVATLAAEPWATTTGLLLDGVTQLWSLRIDNIALTQVNQEFVTRAFWPEVVEATQQSAIWTRPWVTRAMSGLIEVGTGIAAAGLFILLFYNKSPRPAPLTTLLIVCLAAYVLNAMICGMLASPFGRFQARVAWIFPFLLILSFLALRYPVLTSLKIGEK